MLNAASRRTRHLAPGDKLGKYEVIRQIAIGGMAELYLARTLGIEGFEKLVVIKRILPQYVTNASFVNMFLNEARLAATLHHPNIAQVYDIGLEDGDYFFAMEYVHGEDLDHIAMASEEQGVPLSMDASLTLVAGLCAGLHYAHEKMNAEGKPLNIVHRDVSPSNVLVSYDGAVKLVDFGIARASSRPGTTQGGLKGKISYMSPEQCRAKATIDRRSDLYSVGAILFELTTGQRPFTGETEYQVLNQIVNEDAPPPSSLVPGYPVHLERIVLRALARDPDRRYASALELQTDVEDFAHESRLRISPLVLGRVMGTLFPARLEEWDHAKAQGAFFVEQHVVRTLIESGKTPEPNDDARAAAEAAQARQDAAVRAARLAMQSFDDDAPTSLEPRYVDQDTAIAAPLVHTAFDEPEPSVESTDPAFSRSREITVLPHHDSQMQWDHASVEIPASPEPRPQHAYPVVSELMSATPGSLVTAAGKYGGLPTSDIGKAADPTERVRVPLRRLDSPTAFVRAPSRVPLVAIIGLVGAAGAIAAFIALRGGRPVRHDQPAPPAETQVEMQVTPAPQAAPVPAPAPEPMPAEPAPVTADAVKPAAKKVVRAPAKKQPGETTKPEPKKTEPKKAEPKKPAKETTWNADSPFMPVRTNKK